MFNVNLNKEEYDFFEYMVGGTLPEDDEEAMRIVILEGQVMKAVAQCYEKLNVPHTELAAVDFNNIPMVGRVMTV